MGPGFAYMPDFMGWMMLGSYVFWAVLLALGVFVVVRLARPGDRRSDAKAILDERLARGDIDREEYRARLDLLKV
ncbi:MAG TPA: SHOCT domain-containing protein [Candidatus Limnocylindria bacterium]|nr:SHOCT domain-containing protein [Candidatus Limnocylindria bacterium]